MNLTIKVTDIVGATVVSGEINVSETIDVLHFISNWVSDNVVGKFINYPRIPYVRITNCSEGLWIDFGSHSHFIIIGKLEMYAVDTCLNRPQMFIRLKDSGTDIFDCNSIVDAVECKYKQTKYKR